MNRNPGNYQGHKKHDTCLMKDDKKVDENGKNAVKTAFEKDKILLLSEVSEILGLERKYIKELVKKSKLKPLKGVPKGLLFTKDDIFEYIDQELHGAVSKLMQSKAQNLDIGISIKEKVRDKLMTGSEVADLLGTRQVRFFVKTGKLKYIKHTPEGPLFDKDDILEHLDQMNNGAISKLLQIKRDPEEAASIKAFVNEHVLTTSEVTKLLSIKALDVKKLAESGTLEHMMKTPNGFLFDKDDVLEYREQNINNIISKLLKLEKEPMEATSVREFVNRHVLSTAEVAELLGTKDKVKYLVKNGRLRYMKKISNRFLFYDYDVLEYLDQSMNGAISKVLQIKGIDLEAEIKKNVALKEKAIDKIIISSEAAELLGVKNTTKVNDLVTKGELGCLRKIPHGWYLFDKEEVLSYMKSSHDLDRFAIE